MDNKTYEKLIRLFDFFKNRPNHLTKFLVENDALDSKFLNKIENKNFENIENRKNFSSIDEMEKYYSSIIGKKIKNKTKKEIEQELNEKLDKFIENEKFEEAAKLRDYMKVKKYKRI